MQGLETAKELLATEKIEIIGNPYDFLGRECMVYWAEEIQEAVSVYTDSP